MSDNFDEGDAGQTDGRMDVQSTRGETVSFGDYAVLAPGVQIILEGRAVSHSGS